ncbi:MAG: hypothetical protein ACYC0V_11835 [Armatimonadota bacterium]
MFETAFATTELGLRLPVTSVDVTTSATSLRSMSRIDSENLAAESFGLVFEETFELRKAPGMKSAFGFSARSFAPDSDVREVLDYNGCSRFNSAKDRGRDNVIAIPSESLFTTSETSKMPLSRLRAFGLKITSEAEDAFYNLFDMSISVEAVVRSNSRTGDSEVYTNSYTIRI